MHSLCRQHPIHVLYFSHGQMTVMSHSTHVKLEWLYLCVQLKSKCKSSSMTIFSVIPWVLYIYKYLYVENAPVLYDLVSHIPKPRKVVIRKDIIPMKCHSYLKCAFQCDNFFIREHTTHILKHDIHIFYSNLIRSVYSCLNANTIWRFGSVKKSKLKRKLTKEIK